MYYSQHIKNVGYFRMKAAKLLGRSENLFLNRLIFWSEHPKGYGVSEEGRAWIFNTLDEWAEQLKISKSSVRRAISSLRGQGIVDSRYLSANRRDRTLFYAVNHEKLRSFLSSEKHPACVQKSDVSEHINEHMDEHMYLTVISKQKVNKSYKSYKSENSDEKKYDSSVINVSANPSAVQDTPKPTVVQDMTRIWREEFPSSEFVLTRILAKYLVKAFKDHFGSSLKEWKKYLKLVKTSSFIMSGKFKVTLLWAIRFSVMDRLKAGELGVDADKIPVDQSEKAQKHIESLNETEKCKEIRREIVKRYGSEVYNSQFTEILLAEIKGKTVIKYPDNFTKYQIRNRFPDVSERLTDFEDQLSSEEKIEFQIESLNETEKCKEVRKKIAKKFGEHTYDSLFEAVQLQEKDGKLMIKRFNRFNSFIKNKVEKEREYADILVDYEIMTEPENQFNSKEEIEPEERVRQHIDAVNETGKCKEIRRKIAKKFGTDTYNFLFTEVRFWEEEEKITIKYPNFLSRRRIQKKYAEIFTDCGITETEEEKRRLISFEEEAQLHIESLDETKKCKEVRKNIVKKLGERVYINFFKEVQLQEKDEKLSITYPKLFRKEWIPKRYADIFDGITGEYEEEMKSEEASSEKEMQRTITLENEVQRHIEFSAETEKCKEVRRKIVKKLGVETYNTYFRKIQFQEKNGKLSAIYLDSVMEWWIQKKYAKVLIDCGIMPKFANRFGEENNMIQCQNPGRKSEFHVISSERGGQRLKTVRPILKTLDSLLKTPLSTAA